MKFVAKVLATSTLAILLTGTAQTTPLQINLPPIKIVGLFGRAHM